MGPDDLATAAELAREAVGADARVPVSTIVVHRLDRDADYVLVQLGRAGEAGWVAAVDVAGRDVMSWAVNPSGEPTAPAASAGGDFVWRPSAVSRSPLYPLLRTTTAEGTRYVDLAGTVHTELPITRG